MAVEEAGAWLTRLGYNKDPMKNPVSYLRLSACSVLSILAALAVSGYP